MKRIVWRWSGMVRAYNIMHRMREGLSLVPLLSKQNEHTTAINRQRNRRYWADALINAAVLAGFNFFATLAGMSVANIIQEPHKALVAASVAAGLGFFSRLMVERGITTTKLQ